jgi:zinc/manganese transport system substrate-binding protein
MALTAFEGAKKMKNYLMAILLPLLLGLPFAASAEVRVFACEPEWSALAEEIAGKLVKTTSATHALQDPHYVEARPSLISKVRRADLVVCSGAQLEIGWLPMLLSKANNPRVLPGKDGFMEASSFVSRLGVPDSVDRAQGDMHPQGNPHIQMNPHNIALVARAMGERLALIDPDNAAAYSAGTKDFIARWEQAIVGWEKRAQALIGERVVCHHRSWIYLEDWLRFEEIATLEPIPGIPPTASHLSALLSELGTGGSGADVIIRAPFQSDKASEWLRDRTGIPAVMLPLTVGGSDGANDLFGLFDDVLDRLLEARTEAGT